MQITRSRLLIPAFALAFGLAMLIAQWLGGDPRNGLFSLALMAGIAALVFLGGGSETIRGLRGDGTDERFRLIDLRATAFAGSCLIVVVLVGVLVELARGNDGAPFNWLGAIAGLAYISAIVTLRIRG